MHKRDKLIHLGFDIGLLLKAFNALAEIAGGIALLFFPPERINALIGLISRGELSEDPSDLLMNALIHWGHSFGLSTWHFFIFYLLSHGVLKLTVITLLWKQKLWAYPLSVVIFSGFIVYQLLRLAGGFSVFLLLLTALDAVMITLTILEYRRMKRELKE